MAEYTKDCVVCGKQFTTRQHSERTCSHQCWIKAVDDNRRRVTAVTKKKKRLIKQRGNSCQMCGATGTLHAHHITPMSDGGTDDDSNLLLVCADCHLKVHGKRRK